MVSRVPFQPLLFYNSVILWLCWSGAGHYLMHILTGPFYPLFPLFSCTCCSPNYLDLFLSLSLVPALNIPSEVLYGSKVLSSGIPVMSPILLHTLLCEVPWGEPLSWLIVVGLTLPMGMITPVMHQDRVSGSSFCLGLFHLSLCLRAPLCLWTWTSNYVT